MWSGIIIEAVNHNGLAYVLDQFPHSVGRIFLHKPQAFGKPNTVTAEKTHHQQTAHFGIVEHYLSAVRNHRRVFIAPSRNINRVSGGCSRRQQGFELFPGFLPHRGNMDAQVRQLVRRNGGVTPAIR